MPRFFICTKSLQALDISSLSKIPTIGLASFHYFYKEGSAHSVLSPEEVWRICWIVHKVVLHQHLVPEMAISRNAKMTDGVGVTILTMSTRGTNKRGRA